MTEQERPRTEAGRALWDHLAVAGRPSVERIADFILAIEAEGRQQARLEVRETLRRQGYRHLVALFQVEGRQQAVREIARTLDGDDSGNDQGHNYQTDDPGTGSGPGFCICGRWDDGQGITFGQHVADEVAGLNAPATASEHAPESPPPEDAEALAIVEDWNGPDASESPKPNANTDEGREAIEGRLDQAWNSLVGDASESPPLDPISGLPEHIMGALASEIRGDASESGLTRPHIESCENETAVWFNDHGRCQCWCHDAEHENRRMLEAMRASESGQPPEASDE